MNYYETMDRVARPLARALLQLFPDHKRQAEELVEPSPDSLLFPIWMYFYERISREIEKFTRVVRKKQR